MTRVGFIGLGSQGGPMARRIAEGGFPLTVWARRPESLLPFGDLPMEVAASPALVGKASDIVGVCVFSDGDVEEVLLGPDGLLAGMSPGGVVAIHSTVHPDTAVRMAGSARERGVTVIDAPVSGGGAAAAEGHLLLMAGGDQSEVDRCRPVFGTFADPVVHLGPVGSGQIAKAVNNLLLAVHLAVAFDTFGLAAGLGLDPPALAEALAHGTGGSRATAMVAAAGFDVEFLRENAAKYFRKDLDIMIDVADMKGAPHPLSLLEIARRALPEEP